LFQNNKYQVLQTHGSFSRWWTHSRPKHLDKINKHSEKIVHQSWLYLQDNTSIFDTRYSWVRASLLWFFNCNQQDVNIFHNLFPKSSTCFGRFLRPSSAGHNCTFSCRYCQPILLQAGDPDLEIIKNSRIFNLHVCTVHQW